MRFYIVTSLLFFSLTAYGQEKLDSSRCIIQIDTLTKREVYSFNDRIPRIKEGKETLMKEVRKLKASNVAIQNDPGGKVIIAFIVEVDGTLTGKRVLKNIPGTDLGEQLLDLVDNVSWIPEKCNGKVVPTLQIFPVLLHARP
jgi:hypothetical protein